MSNLGPPPPPGLGLGGLGMQHDAFASAGHRSAARASSFRPSSPERGASLARSSAPRDRVGEPASVYDGNGRIDFGALQKLLARLRSPTMMM